MFRRSQARSVLLRTKHPDVLLRKVCNWRPTRGSSAGVPPASPMREPQRSSAGVPPASPMREPQRSSAGVPPASPHENRSAVAQRNSAGVPPASPTREPQRWRPACKPRARTAAQASRLHAPREKLRGASFHLSYQSRFARYRARRPGYYFNRYNIALRAISGVAPELLHRRRQAGRLRYYRQFGERKNVQPCSHTVILADFARNPA